MLQKLKGRVLNVISEKLDIPALTRDIQSEIRYRQADFLDLTLEIGALKDKLNALHKSMIPVVLFKGTMSHGSLSFADYSFAAVAEENSQAAVKGFTINFQPDCNISVKSIKILNGVCDIVEWRMCNVDMLASYKLVIPFDAGEIAIEGPEGFPVSPVNRIHMRLAPRPLV
jgi:hypothetical protein